MVFFFNLVLAAFIFLILFYIFVNGRETGGKNMPRDLTRSVRGKFIFRRMNDNQCFYCCYLWKNYFFKIVHVITKLVQPFILHYYSWLFGFSVRSISVLPRSSVKCYSMITQFFLATFSRFFLFSFSFCFFFSLDI